MLLDRLRLVLEEKCGLHPGERVLVGFSGGPDSLCLLDTLHRLGYPLIAAHLDHGLRPESLSDMQTVQRMTAERGIQLAVAQEDVAAYADAHALSVEEAGRILRYRFLFQAADEQGAAAVVVGHNADDQVETVLMHLLRGAGLSGLKGMRHLETPNAWSASIPLMRPLLGVWRDEILAYLQEYRLEPVIDASNQDTTYFRNRLRNQLIPDLLAYNPQVKSVFWRMADVLAADHTALEDLVDRAWQSCAVEAGPGYVQLDATQLQNQSLSVQRRLFRRAIARLRPGLRDIDYAAIERALSYLAQPPASGETDLIAGLRLFWENNLLYLAAWEADLPEKDWPQLPPGAEYQIDIPGRLVLPGGWILQAESGALSSALGKAAQNNHDPYQAWLDLATLQPPLLVRARHPGDRIQPLGLSSGTLKLADLMVNRKLPRRARANWPLLLSEDQIAWAPGLQIAHPFRLTRKTLTHVHLRLTKAPLETANL